MNAKRCFPGIKLEVDGKPIGNALVRHTGLRTHAQADGQPENIMPPATSVR